MSDYSYERRILAGIQYARLFTPTKMDRREITEILEMSRWAPSIANIQPWEIIAVDDPIEIHRISRLHPAGRLFEEAAVLFFIVTNPDASPHHILDAGSITSYIALASSIRGWSVMIFGLQDDPVIKSELNIPPRLYLASMVAVGKRASTITYMTPRKPLNAIVYFNKYGLRH